MSWYHYNDYVSVAERRQRALKKMEKLRKEGETIHPIEPFKTKSIATSFWGKAWCRHLEAFSDYENRLPRGRAYVRNGSVCHLAIEKGTVQAMVSGSSLYKLSIHIEPLDDTSWETIKTRCKGGIGSLIELLQGKISDEIMAVVTDQQNGLFPHPREIRFNCDCPDWADMCKHVAAVMYGVGVRLDTEPELLFKLRGVNHEELIRMDSAIDSLTGGTRSRRRRTMKNETLADVFDIDLEDETPPPAPKTRTTRTKTKVSAEKFEPTGACIRALRETLGISQTAFAQKIGVSQGSITKWERSAGSLNLQTSSLQNLKKLHKTAHKR